MNPKEKPKDEVELNDDELDIASGGFSSAGGPAPNATMIVYASTFVPFDDSFG